jgi:hypothetical protein
MVEKLHNMFSSKIIRKFNLRRMRWAGHVVLMGVEMREVHTEFRYENPKERNH